MDRNLKSVRHKEAKGELENYSKKSKIHTENLKDVK